MPLIGNWAVCDTFCSSFKLKKPGEREAMWQYLRPLFQSGEEFTARFAVVMFLCHYVTQDKIGEGLALQKIRESYRVAREDKEALLAYKV